MAELALHERLLDISGRRKTGPQRVPTKCQPPLPLTEVASDPGGQGRALHQARHVLVGQALSRDAAVRLVQAAEHRAVCDTCQLEPGRECGDRAGALRGAAPHLD